MPREGDQLSDLTGKFSGISGLRPRGSRICQCPLCFELFSGESTFVFHRVDDRTPPGRPATRVLGECQDPASKGMTLSPGGVWEWCSRGLERRPGPPGKSGKEPAFLAVA